MSYGVGKKMLMLSVKFRSYWVFLHRHELTSEEENLSQNSFLFSMESFIVTMG